MLLKNGLSIHGLIEQTGKTFARFPFAILSAIVTAIVAIWFFESRETATEGHVIFTLFLGIPLFVSITLFRESRGFTSVTARAAEGLIGAVFLGFHYLLTHGDYTESYFLKFVQVALILHLTVSFAGFIGQHKSKIFWQFNRRIFLRILLSSLYASVFWVGLSIALLTSGKLFDFEFRGETYTDLWIVSAVLLQTWHFLAGVPKVEDLNEEEPYPQGLRTFVQFLLIPLVSLYMFILYAYMAKILILRDWPKGYLGWLVSVMAVLGVFNLLLIDPERQRKDSRWIAIYSKAFYLLIIPLLLMLFAAIGKRVSAYGLTEIRYFLVLLPALLLACALYFILSTKKKIEVIPISLCLICLLSFFGPWGAYSVALRSQRARATEILNRNHLLSGGRLVKSTTPVSSEDLAQMTSIFEYLISWQGPERIKDWFTPEQFARLHTDLVSSYQHRGMTAAGIFQELAIRSKGPEANSKSGQSLASTTRNYSFYSDFESTTIAVNGYRLAVPIDFSSCRTDCTKKLLVDGRILTVVQTSTPPTLEIRDGSKIIVNFKQQDILKKLVVDALNSYSDDQNISESYKLSQLTIEGESSAKLYVKELAGRFEKEQPGVSSITGLILLK